MTGAYHSMPGVDHSLGLFDLSFKKPHEIGPLEWYYHAYLGCVGLFI